MNDARKSKGGCLLIAGSGIVLGTVVALGGLALTGFFRGSENAGKIEGRWRMEADRADHASAAADQFGLAFIVEFLPGDDARAGTESSTQAAREFLEKIRAAGAPGMVFNFKYRLGSGDAVQLFHLPDGVRNTGNLGRQRDPKLKVRIDGDVMTVTTEEGRSVRYLRVK